MPEYEGYHDPYDKVHEGEDSEKEFEEGDEEAEKVMKTYDDMVEDLSDETRKKLGPIITLIENSYDPENEDWKEFLTDVGFLLSEFEDAADDEEREQAQIDGQDELDHLVIRSQKLAK